MTNKNKKNILDTRTILVMVSLVVLGILVMSAIDSRKGSRVGGLDVEIIPLEGLIYLIQNEEIKKIVYEGYRRDIEDLTIASIDLLEIENVLEKEPFVQDAEVYIDADDKVDIKIYQAKPAIRIMDQRKKSYYLTDEGSPVPISKHASARVTVFSGYIDNFNEPRDSLTEIQGAVIELMDLIQKNPFAEKMIEQVYVSKGGEFSIQPKMGNFKFHLGKPIGLKDKLERMELAYQEVLPAKGWSKYKKIDLSIDGQIVCKK